MKMKLLPQMNPRARNPNDARLMDASLQTGVRLANDARRFSLTYRTVGAGTIRSQTYPGPMGETPRIEFSAVVVDCGDAHALAEFYVRLLGWEVKWRDHDFVLIRPVGSDATGLSFQTEAWYRPPVWPERDGEPHKMAHLDFCVDDLQAAGAHALAVGATLAAYQPLEDVRVFLDPAGHPFCLFIQ